MLNYIFITFGILLLSFFYHIEYHLVIKQTFIKKYKKIKQIKNLISLTETNNIRILWISFRLIFHTFYILFLQYMNNSIRKIDRKTYELTYVLNGKLYKMIILPKRGPVPILQISNDKHEDVTDVVLPYMGPCYDWYGAKRLPPNFFGYSSLTFELSDGTEHTYKV